jgi:predicted lipoprotein with Yx(FWY)xxD motif
MAQVAPVDVASPGPHGLAISDPTFAPFSDGTRAGVQDREMHIYQRERVPPPVPVEKPTHRRSLMRRSTFVGTLAMAVLAVLVVAQCSSSSKSASTTTSSASTTPSVVASTTVPKRGTNPSTKATVASRSTKLGRVLVNRRGRTLYVYGKDTKAGISACTGVCATVWPPVVVTAAPVYGRDLNASLFSTITRKGGKKQLAYKGKPLYTFRSDTVPGQTKGQGLGFFRVAFVK